MSNEEEEIYETIRFEKGKQQMDGNTALKFARSRNSEDPEEGTDFARAKRQQKVLLALAKKLRTRETAFNAERISELRQIFDDYSETDLGDEELLALGRIGMDVELDTIQQISLDTGTEEEPGLLVNPPLTKYNQWVLEPQVDDWSEVHEFIKEELSAN
jgi:anionic cell wall polymer biosynthesis LytR-Cps2A-Psr (LCP) family protein